jgi:acetyl-CoA carboxylase carboxyl transferase subunit beta
VELPSVKEDPLKFRDVKKYADRLKDYRRKTGSSTDAITVALGKIGGFPSVVAVFNFEFAGGSMGTAVGEGIIAAAELAVLENAALIVVPASGGARMQEGVLSLMQMSRTVFAINHVKDKGLPYIVLMTNPVMGGVTASFAMLGDVIISEPGAEIGFAGKLVIEHTIREKLPENFQTAEYLLDHGMVDIVVERAELSNTLKNIFSVLMSPQVNGLSKYEARGALSPFVKESRKTRKKTK